MQNNAVISNKFSGSGPDFEKLLIKYRSLAFSIAYKILKDESSAEDIVQEAFVKIFLNIRQLRSEAAFSSWLYKIVYNESIKYLSKKKIVYEISEDVNKEAQKDDSLLKQEREDTNTKVKNAMEVLSENEYLVITLFYLLEKSIKEIRRITGFSESKIKVLLHRSRIKLAEQIKALNDHE